VPRDAIALNAVVEPMLIRESRIVIQNETITELSGMSQPGRTCARYFENGSPLSLAKANICLDAVATFVMVPQVVKMIKIAVMTEVPTWEPVVL